MTLQALIGLTNNYRQLINSASYTMACNRKYGKTTDLLKDRDLLNMKLLQKLIDGNISQRLDADITLPEWLSVFEFDALISTIQKRPLP